jgi:type II secretory pathway pseudopilin PulG
MAFFGKTNKGKKSQPARKLDKGFSLLEAMLAMLLMLIVIMGLAPLLDISTRATEVNQRETEVMNAARQKLEEIHEIMSYGAVGIIPENPGDTSGPGYFERDAIYSPEAYTSGEDYLLSDSVALTFSSATRTVTVEAIDDAADGTGANDWDQVLDPNTGTVLDYKLVGVKVTVTDPVSGQVLEREVFTILRGILESEGDGSTGEDSGAGTTAKKKGTKDSTSAKKGTKGTGHDSKTGKGLGREGKSTGTDE